MGLITIVRHGQASSFGKNYDQLSERGQEQARLLGEHWVGHGIQWDRVLVGPRERHRETEELVAAAYRRRGLPWPTAERLDSLDEIAMSKVAAQLAGKSTEQESLHLHDIPESEREQSLRKQLVHMLAVTRDFAAGKVSAPGIESWEDFRGRARHALSVLGGSGPGRRVVAFSSGGFTGMLIGCALDLDDDRAIDLMMQVRNGSYTSFLYRADKFTMTTFNAVPHLPPELWTWG